MSNELETVHNTDIIICHDKNKRNRKLADQLLALFSKDTSYSSAVWSEQVYADNKVHISSQQWVIFIGNISEAENIKDMPNFCKFKKLNMKYGWIGTRAVIQVDEKFQFSSDDIKELREILIDLLPKDKKEELEKLAEKRGEKSVGALLAALTFKEFARLFIIMPMVNIVLTVKVYFELYKYLSSVIIGTSKTLNMKKIIPFEYDYLLKQFYENGLKTFTEGSEDA